MLYFFLFRDHEEYKEQWKQLEKYVEEQGIVIQGYDKGFFMIGVKVSLGGYHACSLSKVERDIQQAINVYT